MTMQEPRMNAQTSFRPSIAHQALGEPFFDAVDAASFP